jgi:hypothetical protein
MFPFIAASASIRQKHPNDSGELLFSVAKMLHNSSKSNTYILFADREIVRHHTQGPKNASEKGISCVELS